jgi:deoxyribodipyrimidine photo-lyase
MTETLQFPATLEAALERLAAVNLTQYPRTRNSLDGAVSHLSPYITHGFITLPEIYQSLNARRLQDSQRPLDLQHKFVYELGWREYARHLWRIHGDGILRSLHPGMLPDADYAQELPADIREARTGIPVIDRAVRALYDTGYLHNHARMWLASYVVHIRKVHWRVGADWLVAQLLDGDVASNHLAWQWIAGTASGKPYLFNAENVARYAPTSWHSPGTVIDTGYDVLDALARGRSAPPRQTTRVPQMNLDMPVPPDALEPPPTFAAPPPGLDFPAPDAALVAGRDVWLVHPWALRAPPADLPAATLLLGVMPAGFHRQWPWSLARWRFVGDGMRALTTHGWFGDSAEIAAALRSARSVSTVADPHFSLPELAALDTHPAPRLFADIERPCRSFSQWWTRVMAAATRASPS